MIAAGAFVLTLLVSAVSMAASGYLIQADLVRSAAGAPQGPVCVPNSVFLPGEGVVVRARVIDLATGQEVDGPAIQARGIKLQAKIGDLALDMHYGTHPPEPDAPAHDEYWTVLWVIPANFPAGVVNWSLVVTDNAGQQGTFQPIGQDIGIPALMVLPAGAPNA